MRTALEAAAKWQVIPTHFIGTRLAAGWSWVDSQLAQAFVIYQGSICPGCGKSMLRTADEDSIGHFTVEEAWCEGCVAMNRWEKQHEKVHAAVKPYVVDDGG